MNILLTGSTGFLGKNLLKKLIEFKSYNVAVLIRNSNKLNDLHIDLSLNNHLRIINVNDVTWKNQVKEFNPSIAIHLASFLTSADNEAAISSLIGSNIEFGCNLLDALKGTQLKYFINTGTFAEYRHNNKEVNPAYLYAATKTAYRSILKYYQSIIGFKTINVIPYSIYGGRDTQKKLIDYLYESTEANIAIKMSPGEQVLDYIHINDVINFYIKLIEKIKIIKDDYLELSLGTGIGKTPKQIALIIEEVSGRKTNIEWGGLAYRQIDTMYSVADLEITVKTLDWQPTIPIHSGIQMYIEQILLK